MHDQTDIGNVFKTPDKVNNVSWQCVLSVRVSQWECVTQIFTFRQKNGECGDGAHATSRARLCSVENSLALY